MDYSYLTVFSPALPSVFALDYIPVDIFFVAFPAFWTPPELVMDSDKSSSASPAGKIRSCHCGRRTSSTHKDFHTVCVGCRGIDCDLGNCCIECKDVDDSTMTDYVRHKLSLRCKLQCKHRLKEPKVTAVVA